MQSSNKKLVISGDRVEYYSFQNFYEYGKRDKKIDQQAGNTSKTNFEELYQTEKERQEARDRFKMANRIRSQTNLVRLVNTNKKYERGRHTFLTLTYKQNQTDIKKAQRDFAKFIQRLNYSPITGKNKDGTPYRVRYVAVIEFQKRGSIHFHVILFDVPYIHWHLITKMWGHGSIDIRAKDKRGKAITVTKVAKYMAKYMAKGFQDSRLNGKKKYFSSTNLLRPITLREPAHVSTIKDSLSHYPIKHFRQYQSKFFGNCFYLVYEGVSVDEINILLEDPPPPLYIDTDDW